MPPRFPVLWFTILVFGIVSAATRNLLEGSLLFAVVLSAVLFGQWCIRWLFRRAHSSMWLRRSAMLLPAVIISFYLFQATNSFADRQKAAVKFALAGHTPAGIRDLHVYEDSWTDYILVAYFRSDPASLQKILEQPQFSRTPKLEVPFSFVDNRFLTDLNSLPDVQNAVTFIRTDLESSQGSFEVYTDPNFSFAYIIFTAD